jgi:hypothetical protein
MSIKINNIAEIVRMIGDLNYDLYKKEPKNAAIYAQLELVRDAAVQLKSCMSTARMIEKSDKNKRTPNLRLVK